MLHLIRLELRKGNLGWYLKGAVIANLLIIAFVCILPYAEEAGEIIFPNMAEALMAISTFVRATFIIFASVLIAKLIIDEYRNKTITVLFTYPVQRTKLMLAKIIIISAVTFLTTLVSNIIDVCGFLIVNHYLEFVAAPLTSDLIVEELIRMTVYALASAGMCLIPIYFGMRKKSVPATIISSILIVAVFSSNNQGFNVSSIIAIPLAAAAIGFLIAFFSIRNINSADIA